MRTPTGAPLTTRLAYLADLAQHPDNARNGDTDAIADSLRLNGQYKPIVVARGGVILAGNHTYAAALELGWAQLAVVDLDIDPQSSQALTIVLADNHTSDLGRYDEGLLAALLVRVGAENLEATGYTADDVMALCAATRLPIDLSQPVLCTRCGQPMP